MRKSILSIAMLAGLAMAGATMAADQTESLDLTLTVEPGCQMELWDPQINGEIGMDIGIPGTVAPGVAVESTIAVLCTKNLQFTVENGAAAGGLVHLTGDNTGNTVNAHFLMGDINDMGNTYPWSTVANTEQYIGVGTGDFAEIPYIVLFNSTNGQFNSPAPIPTADTYRTTTAVILSFL